MFSYQFYVVVHVMGIMLLFSSLGAAGIVNFLEIPREQNKARGIIAGMHGVGLLMIFVAGFGLLARIGMVHGQMFPPWVLAKLAIWFVMGAAIVVLNRSRGFGIPGLVVTIALGGAAAYLAKYKPGIAAAAPAPITATPDGSSAQ